MKKYNQKLHIISIIIILYTILRVFVDGYHAFMISITDEAVLDVGIKIMALDSYKRTFLQYGFNILYCIAGIMVAKKKVHKNIAIGIGSLTILLCIVLQFYELAILSFLISILPLIFYIYFAWKSES